MNSMVQQLSDDGLTLSATFPDSTTNVITAVKLGDSPNTLSFSYTTPVLSAQALNTFSVQLNSSNPNVVALQNVQAKLGVRTQALQSLLAQLEAQGYSAKDLSFLTGLISELQSLSSRITAYLQQQPTLVAQTNLPLQVDNVVAQPILMESLQDHLRIQLSADIGSAIQGESTTLHSVVTQIGFPDTDGLDDDANTLFLTNILWMGKVVKTFPAQKIPLGTSISFDYPTAKLEPQNMNAWETTVYTSNGVGKNPQYNDVYGDLTMTELVASDTVAPQWLSGSTPDASHPYVQSAQPVSATLQDSFGLIDPTSFEASLSGTLTTGATASKDITQSLALVSPDQGQTYTVSGNLNPLGDGYYTLSLDGANLAGEEAPSLISIFGWTQRRL